MYFRGKNCKKMQTPHIISFKNVSIHQDDKLVLEGIDFALTQGEKAYIIGKSGSGKSSLVKALFGSIKVDGNEAMVLGSDLKSLESSKLPDFRRKMGMVFQNFNLFMNWTVDKNLRYVLKATDWTDEDKMDDRINEVLKETGLTEKLMEPAFKLSGGEQQRLVIARALLNNPPLIIADEPTGNLDPETSDDILYLLNDIARKHKTAIILATHDYRIIEKFPARVYECLNGKVSER